MKLVHEKHNMRNSKEYKVWISMKERCYNPNHESYHRYGGRGIKVCDRWLHSFINFYEDMGSKPFKDAQIDREENDGDYDPDNCKWTTRLENSRKTSSTKLSMEKARKIRKRYDIGDISQRKLAIISGVCQHSIYMVVNNKVWQES